MGPFDAGSAEFFELLLDEKGRQSAVSFGVNGPKLFPPLFLDEAALEMGPDTTGASHAAADATTAATVLVVVTRSLGNDENRGANQLDFQRNVGPGTKLFQTLLAQRIEAIGSLQQHKTEERLFRKVPKPIRLFLCVWAKTRV